MHIQHEALVTWGAIWALLASSPDTCLAASLSKRSMTRVEPLSNAASMAKGGAMTKVNGELDPFLVSSFHVSRPGYEAMQVKRELPEMVVNGATVSATHSSGWEKKSKSYSEGGSSGHVQQQTGYEHKTTSYVAGDLQTAMLAAGYDLKALVTATKTFPRRQSLPKPRKPAFYIEDDTDHTSIRNIPAPQYLDDSDVSGLGENTKSQPFSEQAGNNRNDKPPTTAPQSTVVHADDSDVGGLGEGTKSQPFNEQAGTVKPPQNTVKPPQNTVKPPQNTAKPPQNTVKPPQSTVKLPNEDNVDGSIRGNVENQPSTSQYTVVDPDEPHAAQGEINYREFEAKKSSHFNLDQAIAELELSGVERRFFKEFVQKKWSGDENEHLIHWSEKNLNDVYKEWKDSPKTFKFKILNQWDKLNAQVTSLWQALLKRMRNFRKDKAVRK